MSNSALVSYTKLSPNHSGKRNHKIDTITIHCMAGNMTVESCGAHFAKTTTQGSSNYGIGSDGRIALYVDEANRSWATSSRSNDHRAVTIEVANNGGAPNWPVSDKAYAALLDLIYDICKRNGIKELKWKGDKRLVGKVDQQNMTAHRWFAAKACPGNYLYERYGDIADEVNRRLGVVPTPFKPYAVRVTAKNLNIRKGPGTKYGRVKYIAPGVYTITEEKDGFGKLKSGAGWISLAYATKL